jgi:trimeric autotransporter adhesin
MITYFNGSSGCYVTKQVTINSPVATISGISSICPGFSNSLGNIDVGGVWSSSNAAVATINSGSGSVTGISTGTTIITYTTSPACYSTAIQTVNAAPIPIGGSTDVCMNGTTNLIGAPAGGTWSSSNMANATISSGGIVRGIAPGVTTIQYTLSSGCIATKDVSVNSLPDAITGITSVCVNATTDLFSSPSGGTWTSSNTVKSTIDATSGVVTGKSAGTSSITYMLPTGCYVKTTVTTKAPPAAIWGTTTISQGGAQILYCSPGGGAWSSADPGIASYNPVTGGRTYGVSAGTTTVTYTIPATGCFSTTTVNVVSARPGQETTISGGQKSFSIFPNPSQGVLNVETSVSGTFAVFTIDGRQVASYEITETATTLSLPNDLASGMYMCKFTGGDGSTEMVRLVYER